MQRDQSGDEPKRYLKIPLDNVLMYTIPTGMSTKFWATRKLKKNPAGTDSDAGICTGCLQFVELERAVTGLAQLAKTWSAQRCS